VTSPLSGIPLVAFKFFIEDASWLAGMTLSLFGRVVIPAIIFEQRNIWRGFPHKPTRLYLKIVFLGSGFSTSRSQWLRGRD